MLKKEASATLNERAIIDACRKKISAVRRCFVRCNAYRADPFILYSPPPPLDVASPFRTAAQFKCPEKVFILDTIPKTATGKVQRKALAVSLRSRSLTETPSNSRRAPADVSFFRHSEQTKFSKEVDESNVVKAKL